MTTLHVRPAPFFPVANPVPPVFSAGGAAGEGGGPPDQVFIDRRFEGVRRGA